MRSKELLAREAKRTQEKLGGLNAGVLIRQLERDYPPGIYDIRHRTRDKNTNHPTPDTTSP
jgi:hypothetical protein